MLNNTNTNTKTNTSKNVNTNTNNTNVFSFTQILQTQTTNSITSNYTDYNSKKQLLASAQFTNLHTSVQQFITQLKNCFCFTIHNSLQFVIITMYYNSTKSYSFYVVNCSNFTVQTFTSIKLAKQFVNSNITTNK